MGKAISEARAKQEISIEELAQEVGVDPEVIERIEQGKYHQDIALLTRIQDLLGVPLPIQACQIKEARIQKGFTQA